MKNKNNYAILIDGIGDFSIVQDQLKFNKYDQGLLCFGALLRKMNYEAEYINANSEDFSNAYIHSKIDTKTPSLIVFNLNNQNFKNIERLKIKENYPNCFCLGLTNNFDYSITGFIECLKRINFRSVGMTVNCDNLKYVYKVVKVIKKEYPDIPVILGGSQVSFSDTKILAESGCDIVVRHEGDETIIKLLNHYKFNHGYLNDIKGISYRTGSEIFQNESAPFLNMDDLPTPQYTICTNKKYWIIPEKCAFPDFDDFLKELPALSAIFLTSRGCSSKCGFCVEGSLNSPLRIRSIQNVMKDLRYFIEVFDPSYIFIGDDTFTSSPRRVVEICEHLKELRKTHDFVWFAEARVDILYKHPYLISTMIDAGLYKLQIGVESGSQEILDIYKKNISIDQIKSVVTECSKYENLLIHAGFILGNAGETKKTFKETTDLAKELIQLSKYKIDIAAGYLTPFVGTPIRNNPEDYQIEILDENFELNKNSFIDITCKPKNLSMPDLQNLFSKFQHEVTSFYIQNIWGLPKEQIDKKIVFDEKYSKKSIGVISQSWAKTYYSMFAINRYYKLLNRKSSVNSINKEFSLEDMKELVPLRLWEIDLDIKNEEYYFRTFKGLIVKIQRKNRYLWEMASGQNTIQDIISHKECPFPNNDRSYLEVFEFYRNLEKNFALIFREQ